MKSVLITLLLLAATAGCSITQDWQGNSLAHTSQASFTDFSGKQKLKMFAQVDTGITKIKYGIKLTRGEMQIIVKALKKEIINVSTADVVEKSLEIKNLAGSGLDIVLIGKKAGGSYHIEVEAR